MHITIERELYSAHSTIGRLLIDGQFFAFTLEPPTRDDQVKPRAIPAGTYKLTNRFSPKHHMAVPHVEHVPGFDEIEIHPGNGPQDTLGCCLVGFIRGPQPDFIGDSRKAFHALMLTLLAAWDQRLNGIDITYVDLKDEQTSTTEETECSTS